MPIVPSHPLWTAAVTGPYRRTQRDSLARQLNGSHPERAARLVARLSGLPYRTNARDLPGSPDIVFDRERVAVFVHGCFWHRHRDCQAGRSVPEAHRAFWTAKFRANKLRDLAVARRLEELGWRVETLWECEL